MKLRNFTWQDDLLRYEGYEPGMVITSLRNLQLLGGASSRCAAAYQTLLRRTSPLDSLTMSLADGGHPPQVYAADRTRPPTSHQTTGLAQCHPLQAAAFHNAFETSLTTTCDLSLSFHTAYARMTLYPGASPILLHALTQLDKLHIVIPIYAIATEEEATSMWHALLPTLFSSSISVRRIVITYNCYQPRVGLAERLVNATPLRVLAFAIRHLTQLQSVRLSIREHEGAAHPSFIWDRLVALNNDWTAQGLRQLGPFHRHYVEEP